MDHSLFNPNQLRKYGVHVWDNSFDNGRLFIIQATNEVKFPLATRGTKIYFESRSLSEYELNTCPKIRMTSESPWIPREVTLQEISQEANGQLTLMKKIRFNENGRFSIYREDMSNNDIMFNEISSSLTGINENTLMDTDTNDYPRLRTYVSHERHNQVSAENVAELFSIGPEKASQMMRVTRQRRTRSTILPSGRRYRANRMYDVK